MYPVIKIGNIQYQAPLNTKRSRDEIKVDANTKIRFMVTTPFLDSAIIFCCLFNLNSIILLFFISQLSVILNIILSLASNFDNIIIPEHWK